jgi:hypothetical protein
MSKTNRLDGLIELSERLAALVARENQLLEERRPREIGGMLEEKADLAATYGKELKVLKSDPKGFGSASPEQLLAFKAATGKLRGMLDANARRLAAVRTVTEGILQAVGVEAARLNQPVNRYGKDGMLHPVAPNWDVVQPTTVALNQVV